MDNFSVKRKGESLLLRLLNLPELLADKALLERLTTDHSHLIDDFSDIALLVAAAEAYRASALFSRTSFFAAAARGRPKSTHESPVTVDCRLRGEKYRLTVQRVSPNRYRFEIEGKVLTFSLYPISKFESRVTVGEQSHRVVSITQGQDHLIEIDNVIHRISRGDVGTIRSPAPSLVVAVNVKPGDVVAKGDSLVVLEAMKMETQITAPFAGTIVDVLTVPRIQVDAGAALLRLEAFNSQDAVEETTKRIVFDRVEYEQTDTRGGRENCLNYLDAIRWTILGYDTQAGAVRELAGHLLKSHSETDLHDPQVISGGLAVLAAFSDIWSLARNRPLENMTDEETRNPKEYFHQYLRALDLEAEGLPAIFRTNLERAFAHYGVDSLEPSVALERAAFRTFNAQQVAAAREPLLAAVLSGLRLDPKRLSPDIAQRLRETLDNFVIATELRFPNLGNKARSVRYQSFEEPAEKARKKASLDAMRVHLAALCTAGADSTHLDALINCPEAVIELLADSAASGETGDPLLEVLFRRFYRVKELHGRQEIEGGLHSASYHTNGKPRHVVAAITTQAGATEALQAALAHSQTLSTSDPVSVDLYTRWDGSIAAGDIEAWANTIIAGTNAAKNLRRITFSGATPEGNVFHHTYRPAEGSLVEDLTLRHCHPMIAARIKFHRFRDFTSERLDAPQGIYSYKVVGKDNPRDTRLMAVAEVRDLTPTRDESGNIVGLPTIERLIAACAQAIRSAQAEHDPRRQLKMNRIVLYAWPVFDLPLDVLNMEAERLSALTSDLGLEGVEVICSMVVGEQIREAILRFGFDSGDDAAFEIADSTDDVIPALDRYRQNVIMSQQRGSIYPYELIDRLIRGGGSFTEYTVTPEGSFEPVERPKGNNDNGFVGGLLTTSSERYPEGITRVVLLGDPTKELASLAESECRMVIGALALAKERQTSLEWYAVSAGARISMTSGTENMDWISIVLRRLIEFTQGGGEINIVITGITVGGQPYWNAEATMLMHTKGILIMTPDGTMVLTGKQSLDVSGGVSAEDNFGLGGYDRIMGPNGQAQYWAPNLEAACEIMRQHNEHAYRAPGERFARRADTADDPQRDVSSEPHDGFEFETVGEVFAEATNPGRKKPFDIRSIMRAVSDQDQTLLERWKDMRDADTAVVFEAHLGGHPVMMLGIASRAIPRKGLLPADGPDVWTSGTLFPMSSKKLARAINSASGNRPLIVLANLSGFDGSPESLIKCQLEYGAEIGRAVTNFDGPIVFCVVSRYHGGAFVVFSKVLNDNMEVLAVEGTYASVLGGAPAAAVVFTREVDQRTDADERIVSLGNRIATTSGPERVTLQAELAELRPVVRAETLGKKAAEYDAVHTIQRAQEMGSVDAIIPGSRLRPELIAALERGMARTLDKLDAR